MDIAFISKDMIINWFIICSPHKCKVNAIDLNVPFLRSAISESELHLTNTTTSVTTIYQH